MSTIEDIIQAHHGILFKICRAYADDEDFDDLYQECLINIWKGLKSFEGDSKLSTWVYRVALNTSLTYSRNQKTRNKNFSSGHQKMDQVQDDSENELEERIELLLRAVRELEKNDRSVILLYLDKKSYKEISEILGITATNVGAKINRIKKKLFELIKTLENEG
ncbi:MAG: sigma-70 family RNA polymerase sigma factor [Crocinitomicaceae bacterium]|nr:sigma-70 family RNA polymerase sigma factor [Crocinitomicaceae bacterium]